MNKKAETEYKQLVKLGVTESLAKLIILNKHCPELEESKFLLNDEITEQYELMCAIQEYKFNNLESNNIVYDKDKNSSI